MGCVLVLRAIVVPWINWGLWVTDHLPLPRVNINTCFSLRVQLWLRGGVGGQLTTNPNWSGSFLCYGVGVVQCQLPWVACEQALRGTLAAGREKEGNLATTSLELQFPCGSPSTELLDFRQSAKSGNDRKSKQTLKNTCQGNDVITDVISANQHFVSTFSTQTFKFQRRSCKLSFFFPPRHQSSPESLLLPQGVTRACVLPYGGWARSDCGRQNLVILRHLFTRVPYGRVYF